MGISAISKKNEKRAKKLVEQLKSIDNRLDDIIRTIATTRETSSAFWSAINRDIRAEYTKAQIISANWTNEQIPIVYREQIRVQLTKIKSKTIRIPNPTNYTQFINTDIAKQSLASLIGETNATFATGYQTGQKTILRMASLTQQINVEEKEIEKAIARGFIEKGTANESTKQVRNELLKKSLDGKYITIINKNGDPMSFKIKSYANLVARTKLQEASTQAVVNTTIRVGGDLIQVSSHNTTTPICQEFEGKIFSLTGNDPDFPKATALSPFHPNCLHSISTVFREALEIQKTLDQYIDFSQGETEIHPTRKSHIPVSQRGKND